jgi:hypothetical protein
LETTTLASAANIVPEGGRAKTRTVSNHDLNQRSSLPLERAAKNTFGTGGLRPSSSGYPASWRYLRTILNAISKDCS